MARLMRTKPGYLDIVAEQIRVTGGLVDLAGKELLLIIEARAPGKVAADFQILAQAGAQHIRCGNAGCWISVVLTAGGVNVVIAGPLTQR